MIGNSSLKWSTIPALNGRPFKAGIANQIFNWFYLYISCWMGGWWHGSDHNDLSLCMESYGRPFKAGMVDHFRLELPIKITCFKPLKLFYSLNVKFISEQENSIYCYLYKQNSNTLHLILLDSLLQER